MVYPLAIKVCGMRDSQEIAELSLLPLSFMGFIFYAPSPRFVGDVLSKEALDAMPNTIIKTAVFVNETFEEIKKIVSQYNFKAVQLHGNESPEMCKQVKQLSVVVIKAIKGEEQAIREASLKYKNSVDYLLFDTPTKEHGGSGIMFDWDLLQSASIEIPFFLSGGISIDSISHIQNFKHPYLYGVDVNSKFEIAPANKNITLVREFVKQLKHE